MRRCMAVAAERILLILCRSRKRKEEEKLKVLVIIPAYNEAENIERVVTDLKQRGGEVDYIVVNDGSKDNTAKICRDNGYALLDLPVNLGLAGAFQAGMLYAFRKGYDAAIQFDGDGQHDSAYILPMAETMEKNNYDIVIGSRFCEQKKPRSLRMLGSRLISAAIWITTGKRITDPTSGMRMYSARLLERFSGNMNYGPEPDTLAYLLRQGARVKETQVVMHERIAGTSYLSLGRSVRYMLNMFISILFIQFFRPGGKKL